MPRPVWTQAGVAVLEGGPGRPLFIGQLQILARVHVGTGSCVTATGALPRRQWIDTRGLVSADAETDAILQKGRDGGVPVQEVVDVSSAAMMRSHTWSWFNPSPLMVMSAYLR